MKKDEMMILLVFPNLLSFMYSNWIKKEDKSYDEYCSEIDETIDEICGNQRKDKIPA